MKTRCVVSLIMAIAANPVLIACHDVNRLVAPRPPGSTPSFALNPAGRIEVSGDSSHGWILYDDQHDSTCTDVDLCAFASGPLGSPLGPGSAELATPASTDGIALLLPDYGGTRFDRITKLSYSTYRQSADPSKNLAIALQFNVDYDLSDTATAWQGRIVFEPYQGIGGNVPDSTWQEWDALSGRWWGTRSFVWKGGAIVSNPCLQATPCTWSQLLSHFPNIGIHASSGAVLLKAGSGWPGFRGNVDALTIGIDSVNTTFDFEAEVAGSAVPNSPPDTIASGLLDSLGVVGEAGSATPGWYKGVAVVVFKTGASRTERQAAIQAVGGTVIGGFPFPAAEGYYFVRIADTTLAGIEGTADVLRRLPQVAFAGPAIADTVSKSAYLKPHDGEWWSDWELNPDEASVDQKNWPLEETSAPWAWGCSIGDTTDEIAVVDVGIENVTATFGSNISFSQAYTVAPPSGLVIGEHGTVVAELIAARGNDGIRSTGMMWRGKVALWDATVDSVNPTQQATYPYGITLGMERSRNIVKAGSHGARIINLSQSTNWLRIGHNPRESDTVDMAYRQGDSLQMALTLNSLDSLGKHPLLIIAAGNNLATAPVDAKWNGYAQAAKAKVPDQVIVVGGLTASQTVTDSSNSGPLVDIYAPGEGLWAYGVGNTPHQESGTSFATPLVTGVLGLVAGFNPNLTNAQLREFVLEGARTPASAGGNKVLDAYGALRAAAQTTGGPLCGEQSLWAKDGDIYAARDSAGTPDLLASIGQSIWDVDMYHGGHYLEYQSDAGRGRLRWTPTSGWTATAALDTTDLRGGSWSSGHGLSHDSLSSLGWVESYASAHADSEDVTITVHDSTRDDSLFMKYYAGLGTGTRHLTWYVAEAYPQLSDTAIVAIDRMRGTVRDETHACVDDRGIPLTCHDTSVIWIPDTAFVYTLDVRAETPTLQPLRTIPDSTVYAVSFSEDDKALVMTIGTEVDTVFSSQDAWGVLTCNIEYGDPRLAGAPERTITALDACEGYGEGSETFSPRIGRQGGHPMFERRPGGGAIRRNPVPSMQRAGMRFPTNTSGKLVFRDLRPKVR